MKFQIPTVSTRFKQIVKNAVATGITKSVGIATNLAMVPLTIGYLGSEQYGLWMAISSLIAISQLMDMGIGNALISMVAHSKNKKINLSTKSLLTASLIILAAIGFAVFLFAYLTVSHINWKWIFNYQDTALNKTVQSSVLVLIAYFSINTTLSVVQPVRLGMQEGHINGLYNTIGQILNLLFVYIATNQQASLPSLIMASIAGTVTLNIINLIALQKKLPTEKPTIDTIKKAGAQIFEKGSGFFILQFLGVISYNLDNIIVAHYSDPGKVAEYSIAMKIFSIPGMSLTLLFSGLWAAYADASANQDWPWIRSTYLKTIKVSIFASMAMSLILAITLPISMNWLSRGTVSTSISMTLGMFLWGSLSAIGGATSSLLNGLHQLGLQTTAAFIATIINISASILLTKIIGPAGPIWGSVISLAVVYPFIIIHTIKIINRRY